MIKKHQLKKDITATKKRKKHQHYNKGEFEI